MNNNRPTDRKIMVNQPRSLALPKQHRMQKFWKLALRSKTHGQRVNVIVEGLYHRLLKRVKELSVSQQVFERDMKDDNTEDAAAIHVFISQHIYLFLQCEPSFEYTISYAFNDCAFEDEVRAMLKGYLIESRLKEVTLKPSFTAYRQQVLAVQPAKYTYTS